MRVRQILMSGLLGSVSRAMITEPWYFLIWWSIQPGTVAVHPPPTAITP